MRAGMPRNLLLSLVFWLVEVILFHFYIIDETISRVLS